MLHAGGVLGFAAFVVWIVVSIPSARRLGHETMQLGFSGAPITPDLSRQFAVPAAAPAPSERPDQVAVTDRPAPEHKDQLPSASAPIVSTPHARRDHQTAAASDDCARDAASGPTNRPADTAASWSGNDPADGARFNHQANRPR